MPMPDLWTYSLNVYSEKTVEELCLQLQDEYLLDVNCILACCWAASVGYLPLSDKKIRGMVEYSRDWGNLAVRPLRMLRLELKVLSFNDPDDDIQKFRENVKALELEAERLMQAELQQIISRESKTSSGNIESVARQNLLSYCQAMGVEFKGGVADSISRLLVFI